MQKTLFQYSIIPLVFLALSTIFAIIAVSTTAWQGGNLFQTTNLHWEEACTAIGGLIIFGAIGFFIAFLTGIYWARFPQLEGYLLLTFYIGLYVGTLSVLIATLIFTTVINKTWSALLSTIGCILGSISIWLELPELIWFKSCFIRSDSL
ncbi:unnamed protein product [Schistocephalus solidus]|uniref:ABC transporter permease n=1 Tax=Schistocephalus solidus TaxID=70667 RepID=A0A183TII6_SCHSO|nr:unnamed protein product [Schistocephalus solidus]